MVYLRKPVLVSTRTAGGGPTSYDKRWFGFPQQNSWKCSQVSLKTQFSMRQKKLEMVRLPQK